MAETEDERSLRCLNDFLREGSPWILGRDAIKPARDALAEKVERAKAAAPKRPSLKELGDFAGECCNTGTWPERWKVDATRRLYYGSIADILRALDEAVIPRLRDAEAADHVSGSREWAKRMLRAIGEDVA